MLQARLSSASAETTAPENLPVPAHVAIIMDGNGRWAKARNLPRKAGHHQGVEAVQRTVRAARAMGIRFLTVYGFSSENWKRPPDEVRDLMGLLRLYLNTHLAELIRQGVRVRVIGERASLSKDIASLIERAENRTAHNDDLHLIVAFNYGGQSEIAKAARLLAQEVAAGRLDPCEITPERFAAALDTAGVPDPDLVVRTSGEKRLSNFLSWQTAYAELVFQDVLWPDFDEGHLADAVAEYQRRERRFGAR